MGSWNEQDNGRGEPVQGGADPGLFSEHETPWRYHRLFGSDSYRPTREELQVLYDQIHANRAAGGADSSMPAAYTYFGQFIDHDLTDMRELSQSPSSGTLSVEALVQQRSPVLDLDTMYGAGFAEPRNCIDEATGEFLLRDNEFLARDQGKALVFDRRNDENLFISRFLVLFMRLHNEFVKLLWREARPGASARDIFDEARRELVLVYQHVVLHDFARRILPDVVYQNVVLARRVSLSRSTRSAPSLPVEFATAAFRLHAWVRPQYTLKANDDGTQVSVPTASLLNPPAFTRPVHIGTSRLQSMDQALEWRLFLIGYGRDGQEMVVNRALGLTPAAQKFGDLDLALMSVERGYEVGLASGQFAVRELRQRLAGTDVLTRINPECYKVTQLVNLNRESIFKLGESPLNDTTPLWFYLMIEAMIENSAPSTIHQLGRLGGWIVADTLCAAMLSSPVGMCLAERGIHDSRIWDLLKDEDKEGGELTLGHLVRLVYPGTSSGRIIIKMRGESA